MKRLFLTTAAVSVSTAAFNLLGTVLLMRWFGACVYADYIVDLASLSLLLIFLEIIPSSYAIFRVQDDPARIRGLAAVAVISAFVLMAATLVLGRSFKIFHSSSIWVVPYAGLMSIKHYLDIRLQSSGRLREYFGIELRGAVIRVIFMAFFLWWAVRPVDAVWASLACATLLTQVAWFSRRSDERKTLMATADRSVWLPLIEERHAYVPYYLGIILKRLRDNLIPILANSFFISRETLGIFLLAFRGLSFTMGQIRIFEGLLNHRHTLMAVINLSFRRMVLLAVMGQIICIVASFGLIVLSGVENFQFLTVMILSFMIWVFVFSMFERAKAYSNYETLRVNSSMAAYCFAAIVLTWLFKTLSIRTESIFSLILICAGAVSLFVMYTCEGSKAFKGRKDS